MAKKASILTDSFEQVVELGKTTAKRSAKTVKNIAQDVASTKTLEKFAGDNGKTEKGENNGQNHTPLDVNKLQEHYEQQDKQKMEVLKTHLFQLSKQEGQRVNVERKQKEQQRKQQELTGEEEKKRKEEEKKKQQEQGALPKGKQRRSIFSPQKKATEQHTETRPATGKQ